MVQQRRPSLLRRDLNRLQTVFCMVEEAFRGGGPSLRRLFHWRCSGYSLRANTTRRMAVCYVFGIAEYRANGLSRPTTHSWYENLEFSELIGAYWSP